MLTRYWLLDLEITVIHDVGSKDTVEFWKMNFMLCGSLSFNDLGHEISTKTDSYKFLRLFPWIP